MVKHFRVPGMLATRLEESGIRVSAVLRRAGLPQDLFRQTRILVSTEELFALWRAIGEVSKDPSIGLKLGTETRIERFHPMGIAALSTESLGAAIAHMARYKRLSAPEEILHELVDEEWSIQFRWSMAVEVEPPVSRRALLCMGAHHRPARLGDQDFASPRGTRPAALALQGFGAIFRVPCRLWSATQCHGVPKRRRISPVRDKERRTVGDARASV